MSSDPAASVKFMEAALDAGSGRAAQLASAGSGAAAGFNGAASKIPPHHTLTSLSLTHVQFAQGDLVSQFFAYVTLSPIALVCSYVAIIITSRDMKPAVMFAGQLANEIVNQILKRLVKEARPTEYLGDGYGMPSSHSQFMAYFATYTIILMYRSVHLYYHTWQQVVAGTICGIIFALSYYFIANKFLRSTGLLEWIVDHPWARELHVRDTDIIPDLAKFDWEMWQQYRKLRGGKND
ncbi:Dolichyldiphosphatase 1 [Mortierella alpina]|nr:Dolichyldiphosphatase 1 [Mortierella alpina]